MIPTKLSFFDRGRVKQKEPSSMSATEAYERQIFELKKQLRENTVFVNIYHWSRDMKAKRTELISHEQITIDDYKPMTEGERINTSIGEFELIKQHAVKFTSKDILINRYFFSVPESKKMVLESYDE